MGRADGQAAWLATAPRLGAVLGTILRVVQLTGPRAANPANPCFILATRLPAAWCTTTQRWRRVLCARPCCPRCPPATTRRSSPPPCLAPPATAWTPCAATCPCPACATATLCCSPSLGPTPLLVRGCSGWACLRVCEWCMHAPRVLSRSLAPAPAALCNVRLDLLLLLSHGPVFSCCLPQVPWPSTALLWTRPPWPSTTSMRERDMRQLAGRASSPSCSPAQ